MPCRTLTAACISTLFALPLAANASCSDVALVLAIDTSGSIDEAENALQVAGYAKAFQDPKVQRVLAQAGVVDLAAVFWSDADFPFVTVPWHRISSSADAESFAAELVTERRMSFGETNIGSGLTAAIDMFEEPGLCTARQIINISGDGRESSIQSRRSGNDRVALATARSRAADMGVTINALAILNADAGLDAYYTEKVITGPGSFVMDIKDFNTFADAIAEKIIREVQLPVTAALNPAALR
jgi:hypothetical protein